VYKRQVEIRDRETGEWIAKQDVGTTGYTEKEKSQASDSFKRACFNWGIGRELYSAPFIWIPASRVQLQKKNDKYYCNENFHVAAITYSGVREIMELSIINDRGESIFDWKLQERNTGKRETVTKETEKAAARKNGNGKKTLTKKQLDGLETELKRTGVTMETVQARYQIEDPAQMPEELYNRVMLALSRTRSAA